MSNSVDRKVYMKPKVYIDSHEGCPFMVGCSDTVICAGCVETDPDWYAMATHICSCDFPVGWKP